MTRIMTKSDTCPKSTESKPAIRRMMIRGLANFKASRSKIEGCFCFARSLGPYWMSRLCASSAVNPSSLVERAARSFLRGCDHQDVARFGVGWFIAHFHGSEFLEGWQ